MLRNAFPWSLQCEVDWVDVMVKMSYLHLDVGCGWEIISFQGSLEMKKGQSLTLKISSCTSPLTEVHLHPSRIAGRNLHGCGICREPMSCWKGLGLSCHSWQKCTATILWYCMSGLKYRLFLEIMITAYL